MLLIEVMSYISSIVQGGLGDWRLFNFFSCEEGIPGIHGQKGFWILDFVDFYDFMDFIG